MVCRNKRICWLGSLIISIISISNLVLALEAQPLINSRTLELLKSETQINIPENKLTRSTDYIFFIDGKENIINDPVIIYNDRIYLPLRDISVTLGAKVNYLSKEKVVTVELDTTKIELPIKMNKGVIIKAALSEEKVAVEFIDKDNPKIVTLLCDNKAYVPIRFISEAFGFTVTYLDREKEIHFSSLDKVVTEDNDSKNKSNDIEDTRVEVPYDGVNNFNIMKPIKKEDVVKGWVNIDGKLVEREYVKNQILFFVNDGITFYEVKTMLEKYDGIIVGYSSAANLFQIEFLECTYDQLSIKMKDIQQEDIVMEDEVYLNTLARHTSQDITPNVLPNDNLLK